MQEAGVVLHLARSGRLILIASSPPPREGSILVDEKGRRTGRVMELIGPAAAPYLSVQPFTDRIERIAGSKLFIGEDELRELGRRRRGGPPGGSRGYTGRSSSRRPFKKSQNSNKR